MPTLPPDATRDLGDRLARANREAAARNPGESGKRQPVHTVYGGAHLFTSDIAAKLGKAALGALGTYAADAVEFARAVGLSMDLAPRVFERVRAKLAAEPVEDFRIDFEDGYGVRSDADEDAEALRTAREVAKGARDQTLPPFLGIRVKPFSEELRSRSFRTLDLFLSELVRARKGRLPENFFVTFPKITHPEQVSVFAELLLRLEAALGLAPRSIPIELMIETTQSVFGPAGEVALRELLARGDGRVVAAHFGTYDYTAGVNLTAAYQHMAHPACDFARHVTQVALAGSGVWLSDGATNILPVPIHKAPADGGSLSRAHLEENRAAVHRAWRLHFEHVRRSLEHGWYQGWDLHPAQLATRYAAVYSFFLEGAEPAGQRLKNFVEKAAQATLVGEVFDDAATGQGLLNYFLRASNSRALSEEEVVRLSGLTAAELASRSFVRILDGRKRLQTPPGAPIVD